MRYFCRRPDLIKFGNPTCRPTSATHPLSAVEKNYAEASSNGMNGVVLTLQFSGCRLAATSGEFHIFGPTRICDPFLI
jgi:hypothetical protein